MREYEVTIIVNPQLEESQRNEIIEEVTTMLTEKDASEADQPVVNHWGMRQLAYPIEKNREGYYVMYEAKLVPGRVAEIERSFQYNEDLLRYLVIRKEA